MTWPRFNQLAEGWAAEPPVEHLLIYIAAAHGYKPPAPSTSGEDAARELMTLFPMGQIKGSQG